MTMQEQLRAAMLAAQSPCYATWWVEDADEPRCPSYGYGVTVDPFYV